MNKFLKLPILAAAAAIPAALMVLGANAATNLLTNPTFDTNTAGWSLLAGWPAGTIAWDAGTLKLTNTTSDATATTATAATQCIDGITVGSTYTIKAQSFIPSGQKRHGGTQTRIFWYQGAGCTGAVLSSPQGSFNIGLDSWLTAKNDFVAPATAKSGRVMLMTEMYAVDPGEDATARFYAKWDNATFTETPVATPTPTSTPTSTPTKAPTKTPTAAPTSTSTPASGTVTPPIDPPAGPVDQGDNQADQPTDSGDGQQSGTPANPTEVPGDHGPGEVVNGLGGTSTTTPAVTKHSTESPLAPSTGTGEHGQQGGLIDWRIFLLGMLALMAVSGLAVTVGSVVRSGSDSEEL